MLKGGKTMQLLLQLNGYLMHSTIAHIEALDVSCSSYHNAHTVTQTAARICRYYAPASEDTIAVIPADPSDGLTDTFTS